MSRVFKVPCFDKPPATISGDLIAQAAGSYYSLQIIRSEGCTYRAVSVLAYEDESLEFTSGFDSMKELCEYLHRLGSFDKGDDDEDPIAALAKIAFQSGARSWGLAPLTVDQDVMEVAGEVLDIIRRYVSGLESAPGE